MGEKKCTSTGFSSLLTTKISEINLIISILIDPNNRFNFALGFSNRFGVVERSTMDQMCVKKDINLSLFSYKLVNAAECAGLVSMKLFL